MRKYKITKTYTGLFWGCFIWCSLFALFGVWCIKNVGGYESAVFFIVGLIGSLCCLFIILFDFQAGSFYVDKNGITMCIGLRKYFHAWEDFRDQGFVAANAGHGYSTYWVYYSTRTLTIAEKNVFLRKTRRDLNNIAFFQYDPKVFQEILPMMPHALAERVRNNEVLFFGQAGS